MEQCSTAELSSKGCSNPDTLDSSDGKMFRHPLTQLLLDHIPRTLMASPWTLGFPIAKKEERDGRLIIAGYASVEVIDSQNEFIPLPVLKEAWETFRKSDFSIGSLMHTNIPVVKILDEYTDSKGQLWKSGVDDTGLFVVAEVRQDIEKGKQTADLVRENKLTGFSIGGEALASSIICEGKCYTRIDKMELHEIAVVDRPANQPSVFTIVKSERLKKLAELTDHLPNLIISPGVAKLAGSVAELGKGHDFDVVISAAKGSFVDRAVQTRIYNELRKEGREDLWKSIQIVHEPEGLGPYTEYYPLYDLVLLRAPLEKKSMVIEKSVTKGLDCRVGRERILLSLSYLDEAIELFQTRPTKKAQDYRSFMKECMSEKLEGIEDKQDAFGEALKACVREWKEERKEEKFFSPVKKSLGHLDQAISQLSERKLNSERGK